MLRPQYPLRTARLLLRPYEPGDLDALHDLYRRAEVVRYLYGEARDRDGAAADLARRQRQYELRGKGDCLSLAVLVVATGAYAGNVSLVWRSEEHRQGEIGFTFHPDHQGRGYATEAAAELLRLGFEGFSGPGLHRIFGECDARNTPSARVMERLGMRREAHLRHDAWFKGEWGDSLIYALLDEEWAVGTVPAQVAPD